MIESETSYPTGMWVIFYRRLDEPTVWKTMRYQREDGVLVSTKVYDDVFKFRRYKEAFDLWNLGIDSIFSDDPRSLKF